MEYYTRYEQQGNPEDLGQAIKWAEEAVTQAPPHDNFSQSISLSTLGKMLLSRYDRYGAAEDLNQAITLTQQAIPLTSPNDPDREILNRNLGAMFGTKFHRCGATEDLTQAIELTEKAILTTPPGHPDRPGNSSNLGLFILRRYQLLGSPKDLDYAIKLLEEAISNTKPNADQYTNLGLAIKAKYLLCGDIRDLDKAISLAEKAVEATSPSHPRYGPNLGNLGNLILNKYTRSGDPEDLKRAVSQTQEALVNIPPGSPERLPVVLVLAATLGSRYQQFGAVEDLNQSIELIQQEVTASAPNNPHGPDLLNNLAALLLERSKRLGSIEDLESGIKNIEEAVTRAPSGHPGKPDMIINLGLMTQVMFEQRGNPEDLHKAVIWVGKAAGATLSDHPQYSIRLGIFGGILMTKYSRFGAIEDLQQAINITEEAVTNAALTGPHRALYLSNLGEMIHYRYERFGAAEDLELAQKWMEESVATVSPDSPELPNILSNLGHLFSTKYQRLGASEDLEQALKWMKESVAAAPPTHQKYPTMLGNLAAMFQRKYLRSKAQEDVEQAIKWSEKAIAMTPSDHPTQALRLHTLSLSLSLGYIETEAIHETGAITNLTQAIQLAETAVSLTPIDNPNRLRHSRHLGRLLHIRYKMSKDLSSLEESIKLLEEAAEALPPDHLERANLLFTLSQSLDSRYKLSGSTQDFRHILRPLYEGWHCYTSPPASRIVAAGIAGFHLCRKRMFQESSSLLADAVKMLPKITLRSLRREDQEYHVSNFPIDELVPFAVSIALQAGEEVSHCLRLLEFGRGLIMGLIIDCRTDLSELRFQHPQVYHKFNQLRLEIDTPLDELRSISVDSTSMYEHARRRREKAADELDETIISIRDLPGFEAFHLPPRSGDLMAMAGEGPIIILTSTEFRSDAIIVTSSIIKSLYLPNLRYSDVKKYMRMIPEITPYKPHTYRDNNRLMRETLEWLWDVIVEPVFRELKLEAVADDSDLPRVWWIGVGLLAIAPFHAAGYHIRRATSSTPSTSNTLSRAISSYTPTIKALAYARQKKLELLSKSDPRILTVTMPVTPGGDWSELKGAAEEVKEIVELVRGKVLATTLECPSTAQVLAELPSYDAIHFACHGVSDAKSPSNSSLLLRKDENTIDRLTVKAISSKNIEHAQIAYLSACSTAENASTALVNESIYIASGFQLAGFSHVLATQWESNDDACRLVATNFYKCLFDGRPSGDEKGHRKVSDSFHRAVKKLRRKYINQPIAWASFIHTGA